MRKRKLRRAQIEIGRGALYQGDIALGEVRYRLQVSSSGPNGREEISGRLYYDSLMYIVTETPLALHLQDGRRLGFIMLADLESNFSGARWL
jgi:hypothetical protein